MALDISALPVEVLEIVAQNLPRRSILAFRLVCKDRESKILRYFSRTCLCSIRTDLTNKSLKKLEKLAEVEWRRPVVHTLIIVPPSLSEGLNGGDIRTAIQMFKPWDHRFWEFRTRLGILKALLSGKFSNCRNLVVDYSQLSALDPIDPIFWSEHALHVSILVLMLSKSQALFKSFTIDRLAIRSCGYGPCNTLVAKKITLGSDQISNFVASIFAHQIHQGGTLLFEGHEFSTDISIHLIRNAARVEKLGMNLFESNTGHMSILSKYDVFSVGPHSVTELVLADCSIKEDIFFPYMSKLGPTLRKLILRGVTILTPCTSQTFGKEQISNRLVNALPLLGSVEFIGFSVRSTAPDSNGSPPILAIRFHSKGPNALQYIRELGRSRH
ncbi:MAG: hypothetical protein M1814_001540 [Vezdaea aestivalis]|nr:MAG: hypothetical protein M1814_001540 [Vezdaea aestivalis]